MIVRKVSGKSPDATGNVDVLTSDVGGLGTFVDNKVNAVVIPPGKTAVNYYTSAGLATTAPKIFTAIGEVVGSDGEFNVNLTAAGFTEILNVQMTPMVGSQAQADMPLAARYEADSTLTNLKGRCFRVTSAGLLAAMQQTVSPAGTKVFVLVIGK